MFNHLISCFILMYIKSIKALLFLRQINNNRRKNYNRKWSNKFGFMAFDLSCCLLLYLNYLKLACDLLPPVRLHFYVYFFNNDAALIKWLYKWSCKTISKNISPWISVHSILMGTLFAVTDKTCHDIWISAGLL